MEALCKVSAKSAAVCEVKLICGIFCSLFETSQSLFWAVFGLIDLENFDLSGIKIFTRFWGMLMFGTYSVINIVVLLNLLIAMMNHSYQLISVSVHTYMVPIFSACVAINNFIHVSHLENSICFERSTGRCDKSNSKKFITNIFPRLEVLMCFICLESRSFTVVLKHITPDIGYFNLKVIRMNFVFMTRNRQLPRSFPNAASHKTKL